MGLMPFVIIFAIFWFLLIRPQQKQQSRHRDLVASLKRGDKVVTSGGLLGTVVDVREKTLSMRIADGVKVETLKSAVSGLQQEAGEAKESH